MTKKFVRSEWKDEAIGFERNHGKLGIEASSLVLDLFQSFEERIEMLERNIRNFELNPDDVYYVKNENNTRFEYFVRNDPKDVERIMEKMKEAIKTTSTLKLKFDKEPFWGTYSIPNEPGLEVKITKPKRNFEILFVNEEGFLLKLYENDIL